jgi:nitronate monooxygenase
MNELMSRLGLAVPLIGAPMAGGPSGPDLVCAVSNAGGIGFAAAGYKSAEMLAAQLAEIAARTPVFGVNVFVPNPLPIDRASFHAYAQTLRPDAARYGIDLSSALLVEDDDQWQAKLDLLLGDPVPVVSFTFGLPDPATVTALQSAGTAVVLTVTSAREAALAAALVPDALAVQSADAGGHYGTFTPEEPSEPLGLADLLQAVGAVTDLPLIAAGGIASADQSRAAIEAGADLIAIGTALVLTDESDASATYKAGLADPRRTGTVVTRAFTGRPARALRNEFTDAHSAAAPLGYPAIHHLTSHLRRAAAAEGDADRINLWAGTGYQHSSRGPAAGVVADLVHKL